MGASCLDEIIRKAYKRPQDLDKERLQTASNSHEGYTVEEISDTLLTECHAHPSWPVRFGSHLEDD